MKATEFRIGNIVNYCNSVKQLDAELFLQLLKYTTPFEPIPLTEEWLIEFGFKYDKTLNYYCKYESLKIDLTDNMICISDSWEWKELYYVHQLQNLYFALTGEELTINENNA